MLSDAVGTPVREGDVVGTITGRQNPIVVTATVLRIGTTLLSCEVLTAAYTGEPVSRYANQLPKPGDPVRLHAWRTFRLGPCGHERESGRS